MFDPAGSTTTGKGCGVGHTTDTAHIAIRRETGTPFYLMKDGKVVDLNRTEK